MSDPSANAALNKEIEQGAKLNHASTSNAADASLAQAKTLLAVKKGKDALKNHVDAPNTEPSDAIKEAFKADQAEKK